jgi:8-oxo-dGTP pyrophosphatase MutT (NUDIX family)
MTTFQMPPLDGHDQQLLQAVLAQARQGVPHELASLMLGPRQLGFLLHQRAQELAAWLPVVPDPDGWRWQAEFLTPVERSAQLRVAALALREAGHITGWRDEDYASWGTVDVPGEAGVDELFRLERAMFRYFGFRSHAVHINGFTPDGCVWSAQRAWTKATDPGMGDNLAAGGLAAGESLLSCAWRELREEAGLVPDHLVSLSFVGSIVTERMEHEGWHSESLQVFNALLKPDVTPINLDGEVHSFSCLGPAEVMDALRRRAWTVDAACAMALGWRAVQRDSRFSLC